MISVLRIVKGVCSISGLVWWHVCASNSTFGANISEVTLPLSARHSKALVSVA